MSARASMPHPVQLEVAPATRIPRVHVVIRLVLLVALTMLGFSSIYWCLYLALPAVVALAITKKGGAAYLSEDAPRVVRALRWIATTYAYLSFLSNELPTAEGSPADLQIETGGTPTVGSSLLRLLYGLPALLLVAILSFAGTVVWIVAAFVALATERVPAFLSDFLALTLRVQLRFVAYHLSIVDRYPSFESSVVAAHRRSAAAAATRPPERPVDSVP